MIAYFETLWDQLFNIATIPLSDVPRRFALIMELMKNPRANMAASPYLLFVILDVILILIVIAVLVWLFISRKKKNEYEYMLLDEEGKPMRELSKEEVEAMAESKPQTQHSAADNGLQGLLTLLIIVCSISAMWITLGISTQTETFCQSCHVTADHGESIAFEGSHYKVGCVRCHETGSTTQSVTINPIGRIFHAGAGLAGSKKLASTYGVVTSRACRQCHEETSVSLGLKQETVFRTGMAMSHKQPVEAGMSCMNCHIINPSQIDSITDTGMEVCLKCHDSKTASTDCSTCHKRDPLSVAKANDNRDMSGQLVANNTQYRCYDCHDPKPCDSCHGIRMPHSEKFMQMAPDGHPVYARKQSVRGCFKCHVAPESPLGAGDCYVCHEKGSL